jgi:hypothetical protein
LVKEGLLESVRLLPDLRVTDPAQDLDPSSSWKMKIGACGVLAFEWRTTRGR